MQFIEFFCKDCDVTCVGQTKRNLKTKINEHKTIENSPYSALPQDNIEHK